MDYEINCICGHRFVLSDTQLKSPVSCPACGQRLTPVMQTQATTSPGNANLPIGTPQTGSSTSPTPTTAEPTKRCPFCGEVILAIARKCKHCGEFLDRSQPAPLSGTPTTSTPATPEEPVYTLTTSQWDNFWKFIILATLALFISAVTLYLAVLKPYAPVAIPCSIAIAGLIAWAFYLRAKSTHITIRPTRIDVETGLLTKDLNSLELFRINDTEFKQSLLERILGIGTIHLKTNDTTSSPDLTLHQIPRAREVYKYLQAQIPLAAKQRGAVYLEK